MARKTKDNAKAAYTAVVQERRTCLRCDRPFLSEGRHNRLCDACRAYLAASPQPPLAYTFGYVRTPGD